MKLIFGNYKMILYSNITKIIAFEVHNFHCIVVVVEISLTSDILYSGTLTLVLFGCNCIVGFSWLIFQWSPLLLNVRLEKATEEEKL